MAGSSPATKKQGLSSHWRERRRQIDVGLLRYQMTRSAGWRPDAIGDGFFAQPRALIARLIRPDLHEADRRAGDRDHRRQHGRHAYAAWDGFAPQFNSRSQSVPGRVSVSPVLAAM